ncbi:MAG: protein kinase [Candidatus Krumholzibacteriia bacterium]
MVHGPTRRRTGTAFALEPGSILADKYRVLDWLGTGWEGEVYRVRELLTGIERSAKLFFPRRNRQNRTVRRYARKLHKLRQCAVLIKYHTQEAVELDGQAVTMLVSDYVEGEVLSRFLARQPGRRLDLFQALNLLHALTGGLAEVHEQREYHGDLHIDNVIVRRSGLSFEPRLLDLYHREGSATEGILGDVTDLVRILYDVLGGARLYRRQPPEIKAIICGLKRSLILSRFRNARQLQRHLVTFPWTSR